MPWSVGRVAALSLLPLWLACGGGDAAPVSTAKRVCSPDTGYTCTRFNCTGYQRCLPDGSGFSPCVCDSASGGAGADDDAGTGRAVERCGNGVDDDGDGRLDCDDADCSSMRCSPAAPRDWQGPVVLHTGAEPASCAGNFEQEAFRGGSEPSGAPASCSSCSCGGAGCSEFVEFVTGADAQCGGVSCTTSVNQSCGEIMPACLSSLTSAALKTQLPSQSGCKPTPQKPTIAQASWKTQVRACRPGAVYNGGCPTDQVCLQAEDREPYCIWRDGEHECPDGKYSARQLFHRELADTRSCSECSCKAPGCDYRWRIYNAGDASCATPILELKSEGQCVQVDVSAGKLRVGAAVSGGGACEASGGVSSGEVRGAEPVTVCCTAG